MTRRGDTFHRQHRHEGRGLLELRTREWPRFREGARRDERDWVKSLDDRALARLARGLASVDRAVATFRAIERKPDSPSEFRPPKDVAR